jgi:hypothetical protein
MTNPEFDMRDTKNEHAHQQTHACDPPNSADRRQRTRAFHRWDGVIQQRIVKHHLQ